MTTSEIIGRCMAIGIWAWITIAALQSANQTGDEWAGLVGFMAGLVTLIGAAAFLERIVKRLVERERRRQAYAAIQERHQQEIAAWDELVATKKWECRNDQL